MKTSSGTSSILGMICIVIGLFFDGWLGYEEDNIKSDYNVSAKYLMCVTSAFAGIFGLICIFY